MKYNKILCNIVSGVDDIPTSSRSECTAGSQGATSGQLELKLNITESQLVLVEDASVWDTNAVILKVSNKNIFIIHYEAVFDVNYAAG